MAKLNKQPKFQLKLNSRVTRVTRSEGRVTATFFDPEAKEKSSVTGTVTPAGLGNHDYSAPKSAQHAL